jgi:DNA-binding CsgD family transcriptional regulator
MKLSPREIDVLRLVARGYTYAAAAERLGLSAHTVASHIKKIYRKLGVHSAGAAVMRAVKLGFIELNARFAAEPPISRSP